MRTFGIWLTGLLASCLIGGFAWTQIANSDRSGEPIFGAIAGMLVFACVRLWIAPRRNIKRVAPLLFVGVALALTPKIASAGSVGPDWVMLQPPGEVFRIYAPLYWTPTPASGTTKLQIENLSKGYGLYASCAVSIMPTPQTNAYTQQQLDEWLTTNGVPEAIITNSAAVFHDFSLRARKVITVNNRPAAYVMFSGKLVAKTASLYSVTAEVGELRPSVAYMLACSASDADNGTPQQAEASWRMWRSDIEGILSSFEFDQ
jgi:hypothetical protein